MLGAGFAYRIGNHLGKKIGDKISGTDKLIEWNLAKELYGEDVCRYLEKMNSKPTSLMTDRERQAFNIVKTVTKQWNRSFDSGKYDIPERMKEMDAEAKTALDWDNKDKSKWRTRLKETYPSELFFFVDQAEEISAPTSSSSKKKSTKKIANSTPNAFHSKDIKKWASKLFALVEEKGWITLSEDARVIISGFDPTIDVDMEATTSASKTWQIAVALAGIQDDADGLDEMISFVASELKVPRSKFEKYIEKARIGRRNLEEVQGVLPPEIGGVAFDVFLDIYDNSTTKEHRVTGASENSDEANRVFSGMHVPALREKFVFGNMDFDLDMTQKVTFLYGG